MAPPPNQPPNQPPVVRPRAGVLPLLPLRTLTLLPGLAQPVELGRAASVDAVRRARERGSDDPLQNLVVVATHRDAMVERPRRDDLHPIGVLAEITQALQGMPGRMTAVVRGIERVRILDVEVGASRCDAQFQRAHETMGDPTLAYAYTGALQDLVKQYESLQATSSKNRTRAQALAVLLAERAPATVADLAAAHVGLEHGEIVDILHELQISERLRKVIEFLSHRVHVLQVRRDLDRHVREHLSRHEQEALLRHKLRAIRSELGEAEEDEHWIDELEQRIGLAELTAEARALADRELGRLRRMNPQSGEATISRTWLELVADLPWGASQTRPDVVDIAAARDLLEREHYGLEKVKKRLIEYLGVRKLAPGKRGPILCLVGPPGVGKTSLGRSIASALGRKFVRASLGGVRDDAEIRGHRRTYVGALPGRILQSMRRAGSTNPVFLLDEIDKLAAPDLRGDPAGALLEALDPEQNAAFEDHYLGCGYDLSKVIFVCTANDLGPIPVVLRDRLEIIELTGYTIAEKVAIARDYLVPRAIAEHGLAAGAVPISDDVLEALVVLYTRESGVRNLQREVEALLRDTAMSMAEGAATGAPITVEDLARVLGPARYHDEILDKQPSVGTAVGLGWTPVGGRLLFVEAATTPGDGHVRLTGRLGEVMRESAETALSLVRSRAESFGIDRMFLRDRDVHVHFPDGGVPKDGPSGGITVTTALVSTLTGRPVRTDLAMTGEITLRGKVLPIGGVREKVLAAHRAGIRDVVLPHGNRKDEPEIPAAVRDGVTLHFVSGIDEVLALALLERPPADA
ncbi:MAG: endopeptidase La [Deltaproteobacteria bacterium]|nr:endopeptidase La [Deltaproteobacteria bacterium]